MAGAGGDDGGGGGAGEAMTGGRGGGNNGTGGTSATGGGNGSGGAVASGGTHATGGGNGGGGAPASGGRVGSGGAVATGGRLGSGGASGSGGRAGTGGGGPNGAVCDQLAADYQRELPSARACLLVTMVKQCQIEMPSGMGCGSNCTIFVQTADKLMAIQTSWQKNGCDDIIRLCPAIACVRPEPGRCAIAAGVATAECR